MPHLRLNQSEPNPNPHINFISALPVQNTTDHEEARQMLRALAAQVRPVMKTHGFVINSFEEYQYNKVFAGRNWNNGKIVELVLRRADGSYCPTSWLMSTFCHELAHIKHMNHGPAFQALWARLRQEVRQLQDKGYYGDGYWSSGTRLADSARVIGDGIEAGDFPEYMCGGAQTRERPTSLRRRRNTGKRRETVPSLHTGRQTAKRRKAGARVTSKYAFMGEGQALAGSSESSKGKRAASNRAREERALAAQRRLDALAGSSKEPVTTMKDSSGDDNSGSESEVEFVPETDAERRKTLLNSDNTTEHDAKGFGKGLLWKDFEDEFKFNPVSVSVSKQNGEKPEITSSSSSNSTQKPHSSGVVDDVIELTDEPDTGDQRGIPKASGSTFTTSGAKLKENSKSLPKRPSTGSSNTGRLGIGKLVQTEIEYRKKEALGLTPVEGGGRTLGTGTGTGTEETNTNQTRVTPVSKSRPNPKSPPSSSKISATSQEPWNCLVCTLENQPEHLSCEVCATPRNESTFRYS